MISVRYHPAARAELRAAVGTAEGERPGRGLGLAAAVAKVVRRIRLLPRSAPRWPGLAQADEIRRAVVPRHPYTVVYAIGEGQIVVVAIAHMRRHSNYWAGRVSEP